MPAGSVINPGADQPQTVAVETGEFLRSAEDVGELVVGVSNGKPVYLREVAKIETGATQPQRHVWFTPGVAASGAGDAHPAVTMTVTKKPGQNAVDVARGTYRWFAPLTVTPAPGTAASCRKA